MNWFVDNVLLLFGVYNTWYPRNTVGGHDFFFTVLKQETSVFRVVKRGELNVAAYCLEDNHFLLRIFE